MLESKDTDEDDDKSSDESEVSDSDSEEETDSEDETSSDEEVKLTPAMIRQQTREQIQVCVFFNLEFKFKKIYLISKFQFIF